MSNAAPEKAPAQSSPLRVIILLGVLGVVVLLMGYDFMIAKPATDKAYEDVEKLSAERNAKGVTKDGKIDAQLLKPADVQAYLKKSPSSTKKEKDYVVEYYWWGGMPHRNYISVLYYGNGENLRFNTHYKNAGPDAEDLPNAKLPEGPPTVSNDAPATTGEGKGPPMPMEVTPAEEKPAEEKPAADKPTEEKPAADKPTEEKPAADKPAEEKPAADKPTEEKPSDK